jgi:glycosyltransferase involved in cell wall biosynthesis
MADARSSLSRKNPHGAVNAFRLAFPNETDVKLLVKLHKTDVRNSPELDRLLAEIERDPRISLINKTMTRDELDRLYLEAHTFVSLHRAEGFGLPLLEAQTLGLATIATAWSGNVDFTTNETSLLVPYTLTDAYDEGGVYGKVTWAEPDIESAAAAMRTLYDHPSEFARISTAGWNATRPKEQLDRFTISLQRTCL